MLEHRKTGGTAPDDDAEDNDASICALLVPLSGTDDEAGALRAAAGIARRFDGRLIGLFVRPNPAEVVPLLGEGASPALIEELIRSTTQELDRRRDLARKHFDAPCGPAGLGRSGEAHRASPCEWLEVTGRSSAVVAERGRLADLIVFSGPAAKPGSDQRAVVEAAMLDSGRPVLLVPADWQHSVGHRIAITWNGRAEAARALAFAVPLVEAADRVIALTAETARTRFEASEGLVAYLRCHGVDCGRQRVAIENEPAGAALLRAAGRSGADLLVMDGYGRSRLTEFMFGGVTRHVLGQADLPVLIAH